jgi:putative transposon-encoded protein
MKGICFIEPLFHAVINGTKTQTRRIVKPQPIDKPELNTIFKRWVYWLFGESNAIKQPRYQVGEKVYLKEPYSLYVNNGNIEVMHKYMTGCSEDGDYKWRNKLFMPEKYARYFIEITGVKCEQLQDISGEDCIKEGVFIFPDKINGKTIYTYDANTGYEIPQNAYTALINQINGKGTWESNPYVWVYDFKLVK